MQIFFSASPIISGKQPYKSRDFVATSLQLRCAFAMNSILLRSETNENRVHDGLTTKTRQTLVLFGARQVGKTWLRMVWQSIVSQLAKENKKFIFGALRKGARASDFEEAIQWLTDAGIVYRINRVNSVQMP